jgi:hypothetical protein
MAKTKKKTKAKKAGKKARPSAGKKARKVNARATKSSAKRPAPKKAPAAKKKGKSAAKRPGRIAPPAAPVLPWRQALPGETWVGVVDDFYSHISVMTLTLQAALSMGQQIHVRGHTTDHTQTIDSMQKDHAPIEQAEPPAGVGIKVNGVVRKGDYVYRID